MIKLNMTDVIRNARDAYTAGTLQAQKPFQRASDRMGCLYEGPCAIGVSMTPDERVDADDSNVTSSTSIVSLVSVGVISFESGDLEDASELQGEHDAWHLERDRESPFYEYYGANFENTLFNLENKYGVTRDR